MAKKQTETPVGAQEPRLEDAAPMCAEPEESGAVDALMPSGIEEKAADVAAGKYGRGLKLVAALGDDFEAVIRAVWSKDRA